MTRRIIVTCDGCGETWEAAPGMIGALCGQGQVREATLSEGAAYHASRWNWGDTVTEFGDTM